MTTGIKLTMIGHDDFSRALYRDNMGHKYVMVDERLHTMTREGEPIAPVGFEYVIVHPEVTNDVKKFVVPKPGEIVLYPISGEMRQFTVRSKCGGTNGFWRCVPCSENFGTARDKQMHLWKDHKHAIVWVCLSGGHFEIEEA